MTIHLDTPTDLLTKAGQELGTTAWRQITQRQVDVFAELTGDRQWIHVDTERAAHGPFRSTIAHDFLALAMAPAIIAEVLQIREATAALNYGLNRVRFPAPVRVGMRIRAEVVVMRAQQKVAGVEVVYALTYQVQGGDRPACVADVIVLYP